MRYPNAEKGIGFIITAQVFAMVATFLLSLSSLQVDAVFFDLFDFSNQLWMLFTGILSAFGAVITESIAVILGVIGYWRASKDEKEFKKPIICTMASGLMTIVGCFIQLPNNTVSTIMISVSIIFDLFIMVYAVTGLVRLAEHCDCTDIVAKGDRLLKILVVTFFLSAMNALIIRIFELSDQSKIAALVFAGIETALTLLRYCLFLSYLRTSAVMLAAQRTEQ